MPVSNNEARVPAFAVKIKHKKSGYVVYTWEAYGKFLAQGFSSESHANKGREPCFMCRQGTPELREACIARYFIKGSERERKREDAYDKWLCRTRYRP
jgi:hypothetical protein